MTPVLDPFDHTCATCTHRRSWHVEGRGECRHDHGPAAPCECPRFAPKVGTWLELEANLGLEPGDVHVELAVDDHGHAVYGDEAAIKVVQELIIKAVTTDAGLGPEVEDGTIIVVYDEYRRLQQAAQDLQAVRGFLKWAAEALFVEDVKVTRAL